MSSFMPAHTRCEKADLVAVCSQFVLLWIVALSAAAMGTDARQMQFCSLILYQEVIKVCCPARTTVRAGTGVPPLSLETCAAKEQRNRWRSTYCNLPALCVAELVVLLRYRMFSLPCLPLWVNHRGSLLSGPFLVLFPFIAFPSTLLFCVVLTRSFREPSKGQEQRESCIMLNLRSISSWGWKRIFIILCQGIVWGI